MHHIHISKTKQCYLLVNDVRCNHRGLLKSMQSESKAMLLLDELVLWFDENCKNNLSLKNQQQSTTGLIEMNKFEEYLNDKDKYLVFGYCRSMDKGDLMIPTILIFLCLYYYCTQNDQFDDHLCGETIKILNNNKSALSTEYKMGGNTVFLTNTVSSGVHQWRFTIKKKVELGVSIHIGIYKMSEFNPLDAINDYINENCSWSYSLEVCGGVLSDLEEDGCVSLDIYCPKCKQNDIIEMNLDLEKYHLSYNINNIHYGKAFDIDQLHYKAAVCFGFAANQQIDILSYRRIFTLCK
eukprot:345991_1